MLKNVTFNQSLNKIRISFIINPFKIPIRTYNYNLTLYLEYLFFEFDTKFFREVVNVMLTDLASMYLNAILKYKEIGRH